jgi:hypothetical protein
MRSALWDLNPQPLASREDSLATTLHNHICPYKVVVIFYVYRRQKENYSTLNT